MKRSLSALLTTGLVLGLGACEEELPTAEAGDLLPISAQTVELQLPFDDFVREVQVLGGFGDPSGLGRGLLANDFADGFSSRTLVRFVPIPPVASVRDADGVLQLDTLLTFTGGRVVVRFDTAQAPDQPVTISAGAVRQPWDPVSTTWTLAVDTAAAQEAWAEPGAGPVGLGETVVWDPEESDSVVFQVDSTTAALWSDSTSTVRGLRVALEDPGFRFRVLSSVFRASARPSVNPDTLIELTAGQERLTFVYDPEPAAPVDDLRVGGAPAWRTVIGMTIPPVIEAPNPACQRLSCPFEISPNSVIFASLVLRTRPTEVAFTPEDSVSFQIRPVLQPERLPKSPLGDRQQLVPTLLAPGAFTAGGETAAAFTVTAFVQDLLRGETEDGHPAPTTLAVVAAVEPESLGFASFGGADAGDGAPFLRVLLTLADGVGLP